MRQDIGEKWITALESGEWDKGRGQLCGLNADGTKEYCCLGVLCELAIADGLELAKGERRIDPNDVVYDGEYAYLPIAVREWAGMASNAGTFVRKPEDEGESSLADVNDVADDFGPVVKAIRKHMGAL